MAAEDSDADKMPSRSALTRRNWMRRVTAAAGAGSLSTTSGLTTGSAVATVQSAPSIVWERTYGGGSDDSALSVIEINDGDYLVAGLKTPSESDANNAWLVKMDADGSLQWEQTFRDSYGAWSVIESSNGGYLVAGAKTPSGSDATEPWLARVDTDGSLQWEQTYGGSSSKGATSVIESSDGGYVVAGGNGSDGSDATVAWLARVDTDGSLQWEQTYSRSFVWSVIESSDGGYVVAGGNGSDGSDATDAWLARVDTDGSLWWEQTFRDTYTAYSVIENSNRNYFISGTKKLSGTDSYGAWLAIVDTEGSLQRQQTFRDSTGATSTVETDDGDYIITGWTSGNDAWLTRMDTEGSVQWHQTYGDSTNGYSVIESDNGNYVIAGKKTLSRSDDTSAWIARVEPPIVTSGRQTNGDGSGQQTDASEPAATTVTDDESSGLQLVGLGGKNVYSSPAALGGLISIGILTFFGIFRYVGNVSEAKADKRVHKNKILPLYRSIDNGNYSNTIVFDIAQSAKKVGGRRATTEARELADLARDAKEELNAYRKIKQAYHDILVSHENFSEADEIDSLIDELDTELTETSHLDPPFHPDDVDGIVRRIRRTRKKIEDELAGTPNQFLYNIYNGEQLSAENTYRFNKWAEESPEEALSALNQLPDWTFDDPDDQKHFFNALMPIARQRGAKIAQSEPEFIDILTQKLQSDDTRDAALEVLAAVAEDDSSLLEDEVASISAALSDDDNQVIIQVCEILAEIGTRDAISSLRDARRDVDDYDVRLEIEELVQETEINRREETTSVSEIQPDVQQPTSLSDVSLNEDSLQTLPDHEVLELIGSGGNADVKKIQLTDTGEVVALKVPRWQGTVSESVAEEFQSEAATWARIDDHDHIIDVVGSGTAPYPWILLEYMPDGNLRTSLDSQKWQPAEARSTLIDLSGAVRHAHRYGIVHADLKPENVLFDGATAKVGDWGLAKVMLKHSTSIEGMTPSYAAPEQVNPDQYGSVDDQTDIYQLGVIAYEMFTGELPYARSNPAGTITAILNDPPTPLTEHDPSLPAAVDDIILTAIAKEKSDRYESILYFRDDLEALDI